MKLVEEEKIVPSKPGTIKITPQDLDDLWLLYNLIKPGDIIKAESSRKLCSAVSSENRIPHMKQPRKDTVRIRVSLEIKVIAVSYEKDSSLLRLKGKTTADNELVATAVFHTMELEKFKPFDLTKKIWNLEDITGLREGCNRTIDDADLVVVLMKEGFAELYSVGKSETTRCAKTESSFATNLKSGMNKFFETVALYILKYVDFTIVRCVVIGSSGSLKDDFRRYLLAESNKSKLKSIQSNKSSLFLVDTKSKKILNEVLKDPDVMDMIRNTKASVEIRAFTDFLEKLANKPDWACYGLKGVHNAQEMMAIDTLLITDDLFKSASIETRKQSNELVKSVKKAGGKAYLFSSTHVFAEQLAQLTGIAATLRFPVPNIDELQL